MEMTVDSGRRTVLLLGGTGRTGGRVLRQLLDRGVAVRAVVRSAERLPDGVAGVMRELVTDDRLWERWRGKLPVIVDKGGAR